MKKIMFLLVMGATMSMSAMAQEKVVKDEVKVKKTSTTEQKVHNTFSKHKHYNGVKVKHVEKTEKK